MYTPIPVQFWRTRPLASLQTEGECIFHPVSACSVTRSIFHSAFNLNPQGLKQKGVLCTG